MTRYKREFIFDKNVNEIVSIIRKIDNEFLLTH